MFLHQSLEVLHCLLKVHPEDRYTYVLSFHWYKWVTGKPGALEQPGSTGARLIFAI